MNDFLSFAKDRGLSSDAIGRYVPTIGSLTRTIPEKDTLNISQIDIFSRLLVDRIIYLGEEIDDESSNIIIAQLLYLNQVDSKTPIEMYINSPGGSVLAGLGIYDTMNLIDAPVYTTCTGIAASMASIIVSSGERGHRKGLKHSQVMIHQPMIGGHGYTQLSDMRIRTTHLENLATDLYTILAENTGKNIDEIREACDRDNYMTAKEAVEYGLLDEVLVKKK